MLCLDAEIYTHKELCAEADIDISIDAQLVETAEYEIDSDVASTLDAEMQFTSEYTAEMDNLQIAVVYTEFGDYYEGSYTVTPEVISKTLSTQQKIMRENIFVEKIPTREEANAAGGFTFIIGG